MRHEMSNNSCLIAAYSFTVVMKYSGEKRLGASTSSNSGNATQMTTPLRLHLQTCFTPRCIRQHNHVLLGLQQQVFKKIGDEHRETLVSWIVVSGTLHLHVHRPLSHVALPEMQTPATPHSRRMLGAVHRTLSSVSPVQECKNSNSLHM